MSYLDAIILGIIQGLTEFLPVSSSGHLVLAEALLGVKEPGVSFEILVHLGTLLAVLIYFRNRIGRMIMSLFNSELKAERRWILFIIIGTIPAGLVGVTLEDFFDRAFSNPILAATMLIVTGLILLSTRFVKKGERSLNSPNSFLIGIGQAMAIMPGISRSGTTISAGLLLGVKPSEAAEFSFLLSIPAIGGAVVLKSGDLMQLQSALVGQYVIGTLAAFALSLAAVYTVLETIKRGKFVYFAYYCFAAGLLGLYLFW